MCWAVVMKASDGCFLHNIISGSVLETRAQGLCWGPKMLYFLKVCSGIGLWQGSWTSYCVKRGENSYLLWRFLLDLVSRLFIPSFSIMSGKPLNDCCCGSLLPEPVLALFRQIISSSSSSVNLKLIWKIAKIVSNAFPTIVKVSMRNILIVPWRANNSVCEMTGVIISLFYVEVKWKMGEVYLTYKFHLHFTLCRTWINQSPSSARHAEGI